MNSEIVSRIKKIKKKYSSRGFIILGIFGSYARNEETPERGQASHRATTGALHEPPDPQRAEGDPPTGR